MNTGAHSYHDLPVAGSMSPVKITLKLGLERFSSRILGNESTSRITGKLVPMQSVTHPSPTSWPFVCKRNNDFNGNNTFQEKPSERNDWLNQNSRKLVHSFDDERNQISNKESTRANVTYNEASPRTQ